MTGEDQRYGTSRAELTVLTQQQFGGEYISPLGQDDLCEILRAVSEFSKVLLEIHACTESWAKNEDRTETRNEC